MDLKDLRYSIAVADAGSFTRAAAQLRLAQQALSKQIADLERELGVKLFVRMPRGTRLTPVGVAFIEDARATIAQTQRAMARARGTNRQETQRFRVGLMSCPMLAEATAAPLRVFRRRHLLVQLDVLTIPPLALMEAIRDGTLDLAVTWSPPDDSEEIAGECVWERPFGALLPATHPAAARDAVRWDDLAELPLIYFGRDFSPVEYDWLLGELIHRGVRPRFADVRAAGPPGLIGAFVAEGAGWTLATAEESWPLYQRIPGLVFRPFVDSPVLARRWIVWSRSAHTPLVEQFTAIWKDVDRFSGASPTEVDGLADATPLNGSSRTPVVTTGPASGTGSAGDGLLRVV